MEPFTFRADDAANVNMYFDQEIKSVHMHLILQIAPLVQLFIIKIQPEVFTVTMAINNKNTSRHHSSKGNGRNLENIHTSLYISCDFLEKNLCPLQIIFQLE